MGSGTSLPPVAAMTTSVSFRSNTMREPSGDQSGLSSSIALLVSGVALSAPADGTTTML
jgi:hypothetical protein